MAFNVSPQAARHAPIFIAVEKWLRTVAERSGHKIPKSAKITVDTELSKAPPNGLGIADMVMRSHVKMLNVLIHEHLITSGERPADGIVDYLELDACVTVRHILARTIREAGE